MLLLSLTLRGNKNSKPHSMSTVWLRDHREGNMSYTLSLNSHVSSFPKALHSELQGRGTIWHAFSKPPQRRQGPAHCLLWLLVGTPTVLEPWLASRSTEHCLLLRISSWGWKVWALKYKFYRTSLMTVFAPTDRPKSEGNGCVIERFSIIFLLLWLDTVCRLGVYVIRLRQISCPFSEYFVSRNCHNDHFAHSIKTKVKCWIKSKFKFKIQTGWIQLIPPTHCKKL